MDEFLSGYGKRALFSVFPQGWEFFTRSPRDSYVEPFRRSGDRLAALSELPSGQPRHAFGFSRRARAQGVELAGLIHEANGAGATWTECASEPAFECVGRADPPIGVEARVARPSLCGEVVFVEYEPWPWSYREYQPDELPAVRLLEVEVSCAR